MLIVNMRKGNWMMGRKGKVRGIVWWIFKIGYECAAALFSNVFMS